MPRIVWDVSLEVNGPVKVEQSFNMRQAKGFDPDDQFYSDVKIANSRNGLKANVTAYADTQDIAYKAALYFFGNMIDVLCYKVDLPLFLFYYNTSVSIDDEFRTKRIIDQELFSDSFRIAREYSLCEEKFVLLRTMGWYRKGITTYDPMEKFLSFWNVIEGIGAKFHERTPRTQNGAINQIYQCFLDYFGEANTWGLPDRWINDMHDLRSRLAHGGAPVDIHTIEEISSYNDVLKATAHRLMDSIIAQ